MGEESLLERFVKKGPVSLTNLKGEYTIVIENNNECYIITSPYGVCQYYYATYRNELFHDDTVIGVLQKSRLSWSWNWRALADLTQLEQVLENDTLHSKIHRVPPRSILHFRNGVLKISSMTWEELHPPFPSGPDTALAAFNDSTKEWITDKVVVSMSGGFDSRVILSSILKHGCKPLLLTMGFDDSTDVIISRRIASDLGLKLLLVTVNIEDYLRYGGIITALTNGTKTANNWHTYLYLQRAKLDPDSSLFLGTNAAFAKKTWIDMGIIALAADIVSPLSLRYLWKLKLKKYGSIFKKDELKSLRTEFRNEFTEHSQHARVSRLVNLCHNKLLSGLDRYNLEQRVRIFHGNGAKLLSAHVSWRSPFLSREWVSAVWNMKVNWKLGSNWHRFAIAKNYPNLLDYPEQGKKGVADKMCHKAPLLYWLPIRKKGTIVPYTKCPEWFQNDIIVEFIYENVSLLSELLDKNTAISIVEEHKRYGNRTSTIGFMLTMIFWLKNLNELYLKHA